MLSSMASSRNWAGNVTYRASGRLYPRTLDELRRAVRDQARVKALGSRHSFNQSADTTGVQISLSRMPAAITVDKGRGIVSSGGGVTHGQLSVALADHGLSLPNFASLPHISVAGAIQTGTHGSGVANRSLSAAVTAVDLVDAEGNLRRYAEADPEFPAVVVGLGAFGIVVSVEQRVVPAFNVEQRVHERASWEAILPVLDEVMSSAYSVSLFTTFEGDEVQQIWVKRKSLDPPSLVDLRALGAVEAVAPRHPVPNTPADNVTEQLGLPGPSYARLPHFRHDFTPSRGDEIQSEYLVDARRGVQAIQAVRELGELTAPLLHIAEIRYVAGDSAWMSPASRRDSMALHFTWRSKPVEVAAALPTLEAALLPLDARPHWGKAFDYGHDVLLARYPRLEEFADLVERLDPQGRFHNSFLARVLGIRG
jgi:alditol oxidase